jgi:ABC-type uncharacterized transport system substrate-binding protein
MCGANYLEGSAKKRLNVDEAFASLVRQIKKRKNPVVKEEKSKTKKGCMIL